MKKNGRAYTNDDQNRTHDPDPGRRLLFFQRAPASLAKFCTFLILKPAFLTFHADALD